MKKGKKSDSKIVRNTIIAVIIIIVAILIVFIILSLNKPSPMNPKRYMEKLTYDDFKIINASWNIYPMRWGENGLEIEPLQKEIDWDYICNECRVNLKSHYCKSYDWYITTQTSGELICHATIDGVGIGESNLDKESGLLITPGLSNVTFVTPDTSESMIGKLTTRQNHNILVCCVSREKGGEVCDAIILEFMCR